MADHKRVVLQPGAWGLGGYPLPLTVNKMEASMLQAVTKALALGRSI
jgi:hypothetical protein